MKNLEKNLSSKHRLSFDKNGKFKILMLSDIQETLDIDPRTIPGICAMLDSQKPDFVMLCGDNCNGKILHGAQPLKEYLKLITEPMESRGIPWAHVYGNHDYDIADVPAAKQQAMYEALPHCVSKHTGSEVHGKSNFVLPVWSDDGKLKFCIWGLDSNNRWRILSRDIGLTEDVPYRFEHSPEPCNRWDIIRFDQQMWYYKSSCELERFAGKKVPGILFTHVVPHELITVKDNPAETNFKGFCDERFSLGTFNSGIFATVLERGDIKTIASGHLHRNDCEGDYFGVHICLDTCAGFSPKGIDERRGGRVFELTDTGDNVNVDTYMIRVTELM